MTYYKMCRQGWSQTCKCICMSTVCYNIFDQIRNIILTQNCKKWSSQWLWNLFAASDTFWSTVKKLLVAGTCFLCWVSLVAGAILDPVSTRQNGPSKIKLLPSVNYLLIIWISDQSDIIVFQLKHFAYLCDIADTVRQSRFGVVVAIMMF